MTAVRKTRAALAERYAQQNLECAELILRDPGRHGGDESLMVRWALLVLDDRERAAREWGLVA